MTRLGVVTLMLKTVTKTTRETKMSTSNNQANKRERRCSGSGKVALVSDSQCSARVSLRCQAGGVLIGSEGTTRRLIFKKFVETALIIYYFIGRGRRFRDRAFGRCIRPEPGSPGERDTDRGLILDQRAELFNPTADKRLPIQAWNNPSSRQCGQPGRTQPGKCQRTGLSNNINPSQVPVEVQ